MLLQDYATRSCEANPGDTAIAEGHASLDYARLERDSNRLARLLVDQGCRPGDRVALLTPKSADAITAMAATLKAGCAYVPVDVDSPAPRVARIVASAEPAALLATPDASGLLDAMADDGALAPSTRIGALGTQPVAGSVAQSQFTTTDAQGLDDGPLPQTADPADPAHLLFTSGSTGVPKGVVITHANATAFIDWAVRHFGIRRGERVSGHPPLHFDLSTFDIYGAFAAGAELHPVPPSAAMNPLGLAAFIRDRRLNQWFSVPSVLSYLARFEAVQDGDFPALQRLLWCGEVLPAPVLCHWMDRLPHVRFTNLYGPTEATIASSFHTVTERPADENAPIPIGTACEGEELLVLDDDLRPCRPGATGALHIAGVGLSPGYWRDPERTAEVFVTDPRRPDRRIYRTGDLARTGPDGLFHFLGREDSQIKSRGYRIELGEVETAANAVGGIRECAVVGVETGGFESTAICCAYAGPETLTPSVVKSAMAETLPRYMLPARWERLEALPKNVNGKIDRKRLRELFQDGGH